MLAGFAAGPGLGPGRAAAGFGADGAAAAGLGADGVAAAGAAGAASDSVLAAGFGVALSAGFDGAAGAASAGAALGAGAFGPGLGAPGLADEPPAGFGELDGTSAASPPAFVGFGGFSLILRTTGASIVELADFTNSPCALRCASSSLLSTPSSLASSWTRTLATFLLSDGDGRPRLRAIACPEDQPTAEG